VIQLSGNGGVVALAEALIHSAIYGEFILWLKNLDRLTEWTDLIIFGGDRLLGIRGCGIVVLIVLLLDVCAGPAPVVKVGACGAVFCWPIGNGAAATFGRPKPVGLRS
jgi:hypothetical protein